MNKFIILALLAPLAGLPIVTRAADDAPANAQIDPQKDKSIRQLLELSGSAKLGQQVLDQMIVLMQKQYPNVPQQFWSDFRQQASSEEFVEILIPIYAAHFTDDDIQELIKFYKSPIGQKLVKEQPLMMKESMQKGQEWGMKLGAKIGQQLRDKGYVKT